jgi:hypothetical protein
LRQFRNTQAGLPSINIQAIALLYMAATIRISPGMAMISKPHGSIAPAPTMR